MENKIYYVRAEHQTRHRESVIFYEIYETEQEANDAHKKDLLWDASHYNDNVAEGKDLEYWTSEYNFWHAHYLGDDDTLDFSLTENQIPLPDDIRQTLLEYGDTLVECWWDEDKNKMIIWEYDGHNYYTRLKISIPQGIDIKDLTYYQLKQYETYQ